MALWILIAALWMALLLARPRALARLVVRPMRRPGEAERSRRWRVALRRLEFEARDWRFDLPPSDDAAGNDAVSGFPPPLRPVDGPAEPIGERDHASLYLWTATRVSGAEAERIAAPSAPLSPEPRDAAPPMLVLMHGYSDSSAAMGAAGVAAARLGLPSLFVDQMGHGLSGGQRCSYGKREADQLRRLLASASATLPEETRGGFLLAGWSMGAALAILALTAMTAEERAQVRGVALGAPYADFADALRRQAKRLFGLSRKSAIDEARKLAELWGGFRSDEVGPANALSAWSDANRASTPPRGVAFPPALFLRGDGDTLVSSGEIEELAALWPGEVETREIAGAAHDNLWRVHGATDAFGDWTRRRGLLVAAPGDALADGAD